MSFSIEPESEKTGLESSDDEEDPMSSTSIIAKSQNVEESEDNASTGNMDSSIYRSSKTEKEREITGKVLDIFSKVHECLNIMSKGETLYLTFIRENNMDTVKVNETDEDKNSEFEKEKEALLSIVAATAIMMKTIVAMGYKKNEDFESVAREYNKIEEIQKIVNEILTTLKKKEDLLNDCVEKLKEKVSLSEENRKKLKEISNRDNSRENLNNYWKMTCENLFVPFWIRIQGVMLFCVFLIVVKHYHTISDQTANFLMRSVTPIHQSFFGMIFGPTTADGSDTKPLDLRNQTPIEDNLDNLQMETNIFEKYTEEVLKSRPVVDYISMSITFVTIINLCKSHNMINKGDHMFNFIKNFSDFYSFVNMILILSGSYMSQTLTLKTFEKKQSDELFYNIMATGCGAASLIFPQTSIGKGVVNKFLNFFSNRQFNVQLEQLNERMGQMERHGTSNGIALLGSLYKEKDDTSQIMPETQRSQILALQSEREKGIQIELISSKLNEVVPRLQFNKYVELVNSKKGEYFELPPATFTENTNADLKSDWIIFKSIYSMSPKLIKQIPRIDPTLYMKLMNNAIQTPYVSQQLTSAEDHDAATALTRMSKDVISEDDICVAFKMLKDNFRF